MNAESRIRCGLSVRNRESSWWSISERAYIMVLPNDTKQDGEVESRKAHILENDGSNPPPAIPSTKCRQEIGI